MPGADVTAVEFVEGKTDDKGKDEAKDAAGGIKNPKKDGSPDKEVKSAPPISQQVQHGFMNPAMVSPANSQVGVGGVGASPLWGLGGYTGPMLPTSGLLGAGGMAAFGTMHQQVLTNSCSV